MFSFEPHLPPLRVYELKSIDFITFCFDLQDIASGKS